MSTLNDISFERLNATHQFLPFDCGDEDLNDFLYSEAKDYLKQLLAVTYYAESLENTIVYFTLSNDKVTALELSNSFWRKVKALFPHSKHRKDYPAVKIGRLGVDKHFQHTGDNWGTCVLDYIKQWMVAENKTGCRFITVDAYLSAVPFYLKNGFRFMGTDELTRFQQQSSATVAMYFDLKQIAEG